MKTKLTISISIILQLLFAGLKSAAQVTPKLLGDTLNIADASALFYSDGMSFFNLTTIDPNYRIPKTGKACTIFDAALWIGGLDGGGKLHTAGMTYRQNGDDFWPGPMMDSLNYSSHQDTIWDHVWKVNKSTIDSFNNHLCTGIPSSIANWPGNGNVALGEAHILAPYVDVNQDGVYDPSAGDYPLIRGDQALFMISNDDRGTQHKETGGLKLGIEVHLMAYAFNTPADTALYQTTFLHYDIYNRSHTTYDSTYIGYWADMDIGNGGNDYIGCDSANNFWYTYNGTATDPDGSGVFLSEIGYHGPTPPPPAQGVAYLCDTMTNFLYFQNDFSAMGNPTSDTNYYQYMKSTWKDGSHVTYGGSGYQSSLTKTNYMFSGNPNVCPSWSEPCISDVPYDRRGVSSIGPLTFAASTHKSLDLALVFAQPATGNQNTSVTQLGLNVNHVKTFYKQNYACDENLTGVSEIKNVKEIVSTSLYPNPFRASATLFVNSVKELKNAELHLYDILGKEVFSEQNINGKQITINRNNLKAGLYFYRLLEDGSVLTNGKFIIE
jgi:hypothetical protein